MYLVNLTRSGQAWNLVVPAEEQSGWAEHAAYMDDLAARGFIILGGPLADEHRVVLVVDAESRDDVKAILAADPWYESHLNVTSIDEWTIRLNGSLNKLDSRG